MRIHYVAYRSSANIRGSGVMPTYKASGTVAVGTGNLSVAWPGTEVSGDLGIMSVIADALVSTPSGWTLLDSQSDGSGSVLTVFWKRATGTESNATIVDVGVIQLAQIAVFSGVIATGNPYAAYDKAQLAASATTTFPSLTTSESALKMYYVAGKVAGFPFMSAYSSTSGAVTSITEITDTGGSSGTGHAFAIARADWSAGGVSDTVTATNNNATQTMAVMSIALLG